MAPRRSILVTIFALLFSAASADPDPAGPADRVTAQRLFEITIHRFAIDHDRGQAREGFTASAAADPAYIPPRQNLALLAEAAHDWDAAIQWQTQLSQSADTAVAARAQVELERLRRLQAEWQTENGRSRILSSQAIAQARALMATGMRNEAANFARTALRIDAGRFEPHAILADVAAQAGDIATALAELREAKRLAPAERGEPIDRALAALEHEDEFAQAMKHADGLMQQGSFAEAGAELQRAFALRPEREDVGLSAANALFLAERHDEATTLLNTLAASQNPSVSREATRLRVEFGDALQGRALLVEARAQLQKNAEALGKSPGDLRRQQDERVQNAQEAEQMREDGKALLAGNGVGKNPAAGAAWLLKAAQAGDIEAMYLFGDCVNRGVGVKPNGAQAVQWWTKAAEAGHPRAMLWLGTASSQGAGGLTKSAETAAQWWQRAADAGLSEAYANLGNAAADRGQPAEALQWWARGAAKNDGECMFKLGVAHRDGKGTPKSDAQAATWWTKGASVGNTSCAYFIGFVYAYGYGVPKDEGRAFLYWKQAADAGDDYASAEVGICYLKGRGASQDTATGISLLEQAVKKGVESISAYETLAAAYYNGEGTPRDVIRGVEFAQKAAVKGSSIAMVVLGRAAASGYGLDRDPAVAFNWYQQAAEKGNNDARYELAGFYRHGTGGAEKDWAKVFQLYQSAAYGDHPGAQCELGSCYLYGWGTGKNKNQAKYWYEKSAEQGSEIARRHLIEDFNE